MIINTHSICNVTVGTTQMQQKILNTYCPLVGQVLLVARHTYTDIHAFFTHYRNHSHLWRSVKKVSVILKPRIIKNVGKNKIIKDIMTARFKRLYCKKIIFWQNYSILDMYYLISNAMYYLRRRIQNLRKETLHMTF